MKVSILSFTLRIIKYFRYKYYSFRRSRISFFDYDKFDKEIPLYSKFDSLGHYGNRCYGNYYALRSLLRSDFEENCIIEHGIYFGRYLNSADLTTKLPKVIYTFGSYRREILMREENLRSIKIISVGPYINYCKRFYSERKLNLIKRRLGKVLTVFPYHTAIGEGMLNDEGPFITEILNYGRDFDTIFLCLYWFDIVSSRFEKYKHIPNVQIVCSGTRNDPYFLSRLRDIIELSDMTMTNGLGTHLGYCVTLKKPVYFFYEKPVYFMEESILKNYPLDYFLILERETEIFGRVFGNYSLRLSQDQIDLVKYYWGEHYGSSN